MKYKVGDNVILNDDVEFWFKKVGGCKVPIVDTTTCSYKIKIGENQYVYIDDNSINHETTAKLKNEFRYKVGDKVKIKDTLNKESIFVLANQILEIEYVDTEDKYLPYRVSYESNIYWVCDDEIDHEATAALNFKVDKAQYGETVLNLTHAMQDFGTSMQENLNRVCNKIRCSKGGETMNANEILEKWRNKKADELISQQDAEIKKVTKEDEIQKLLEEHEREINKIIKDKYKIDTEVTKIFCTITTRKTRDKIEVINKEFDKKAADISEKVEEIKAVLEVAENQDKVFEILNKQGIIDKNYNIL